MTKQQDEKGEGKNKPLSGSSLSIADTPIGAVQDSQIVESKDENSDKSPKKTTPEEQAANKEKRARDRALKKRRKAYRGKDLVGKALSGEPLTEDECAALLLQPIYPPDATAFLRSLHGYIDEMGDIHHFKESMRYSVGKKFPFLFRSEELCRFVLADWRVPKAETIEKRGVSGALRYLYNGRIKRQREQDPMEKARSIARHGPGQYNLPKLQYWARKMLYEYEAANKRGEELRDGTANAAWQNIIPKTPAWIDEIHKWGEEFGFMCYTSAEAGQRPANAKELWMAVFNGEFRGEDPESWGFRRGAYKTMGRLSNVEKYINPVWQSSCTVHGVPSEDQPSAFRDHFKTVAVPQLKSLRMSKNTFLVLHSDCIWPELDAVPEDISRPPPPLPLDWPYEEDFEDPRTHNLPLPSYPWPFLWVYDANWEPPNSSPHQHDNSIEVGGCTCQGCFVEGYAGADEDGYGGRVKIEVKILFSWLYWARHICDNPVELKDIWRKAQGMKDQIWTCGSDSYDSSKPDGRMPGQPSDPIKKLLGIDD